MSASTVARPLYEVIDRCRLCGERDLRECMSFGEQYLATRFVRSNDDHPLAHTTVPLSLALCTRCGLVQLRESVDRAVLFDDYFYRSETNPMMRAALRDVVTEVVRVARPRDGDVVVDIGANDGTLLAQMPAGLDRIGVEPAQNISWAHLDPSIRIINDFFRGPSVLEATGGRRAKIVTSIAMLYSVEDAGAFARQVKDVLAPDGTWCIQVSYLPSTLDSLSFFDVCHEHLHYFTLTTLSALLERNGLRVYHVSRNDVNGGSLRVLATHAEADRTASPVVVELLREEERRRLADPDTYRAFFDRVCELRDKVVGYIRAENERGGLVIGLGGSTKGNVLLQFFGLTRELVPWISERNSEKVGLRTLGTDIELISEERARALRPSCMLVLIWFFRQELLGRERDYLESGGKLLFPMPYPHLVTADGEQPI